MYSHTSLLSGNMDEAIEHLTEAILLNPTSAIMYATRGIKPNSCGLNIMRDHCYLLISVSSHLFILYSLFMQLMFISK